MEGSMLLAFCRFLQRLLSRALGRAPCVPRPASRVPRWKRSITPSVELLETRWVPSAIGGTVYSDLNHNGLLDPGEPGIAGNPVELHDASGGLTAGTTTDPNGHYQFSINPNIDTSPHTREVDATFADRKTNWSQTAGVARFDPSLGTLTAVEIVDDATLTSDIKVENLDTTPQTATGTVSGTLTVQIAGMDPMALNPSTSESADLGAFAGAMGFTGPSARDFGNKSASASR